MVDFSYCLNAEHGQTFNDSWAVNLYFQPPELIAHQPYSFPVDIWALGILTHILLVGHAPFQDLNNLKLRLKIRKGEFSIDPSAAPHISPAAAEFVKTLLNPDAAKRPSIAEVLAQPWLTSAGSSSSSTVGSLPHLKENLLKFIAS